MNQHVPPRNRAERRAEARRLRKVGALGSGAVLALGAASAATTLLTAAPASATTFTVTSLADDGGGADTTLREAIEQANANGGQDTITFQTGLTGTITLASDLPDITGALDIQGPGASVITVDGNDAHSIFNFIAVSSADGFNAVSGLTITGGVADNSDSSGGGIATLNGSADLTIANAVIVDNYASNDGGGVHFYDSNGTMTITGTTISGNEALGGGGALYADEDDSLTLVIQDSTISGNHADGDGGGLYLNDVDATITGSQITGNTSDSAGGAVYSDDGTLSVSFSLISGNTADSGGGGLYLYNTNTTIVSSTIDSNTSTDSGGGGLFVSDDGTDSTLTIRNSTISRNTAQYYGGGLYLVNSGPTTIENSTISGNTAKQAGGIYGGYGGLTLTQVTITNNSATDPDNGIAVGGIQIAGELVPAALSARPDASDAPKTEQELAKEPARQKSEVRAAAVGTVDAAGTIIAGNVGQDVGVYEGEVTLNSSHNVLGTVDENVIVNDLGGTQSNVADPGLAALGDNGGPTQTHALLPGSVAINTGPVPVPTFPDNEFDQRGPDFVRVVDGVVDVGAYEVQPPEEPPVPDTVIITPRFTG